MSFHSGHYGSWTSSPSRTKSVKQSFSVATSLDDYASAASVGKPASPGYSTPWSRLVVRFRQPCARSGCTLFMRAAASPAAPAPVDTPAPGHLRYDGHTNGELTGMLLPWLVSVAALLVAVTAYRRARRTARQLEELSRRYWELKYQHGELKARIGRLDSTFSTEPLTPPTGGAFIPLSSVKR
jgi:hypothetical protein